MLAASTGLDIGPFLLNVIGRHLKRRCAGLRVAREATWPGLDVQGGAVDARTSHQEAEC
jgi:hypothetical protein